MKEALKEENTRNGTAMNSRLPRFFGVQGKLFFAHGMATFKNTLSPSGNATNSHGKLLFFSIWKLFSWMTGMVMTLGRQVIYAWSGYSSAFKLFC